MPTGSASAKVPHNMPVAARAWLRNHAGVWWWPGAAEELLRQLESNFGSGDSPRRHCVVPEGAPLLERLTPIANCRTYCQLHRKNPSSSAVLTALRALELPDREVNRPSRYQNVYHRTVTWLAMARLTQASVLVLIDPGVGTSARDRGALKRLLQEANDYHAHVFVVAAHQDVANALGARSIPHEDGATP